MVVAALGTGMNVLAEGSACVGIRATSRAAR
jgi:hypothetical protein